MHLYDNPDIWGHQYWPPEIRVCGMKNVTASQPATKWPSNPCELLSQKSKHFQKLQAQSWEDIAVNCRVGGFGGLLVTLLCARWNSCHLLKCE